MEQMENTVNIENKEVRGLTVKTALSFFIGVITIVMSVVLSYTKLSGQIDKTNNRLDQYVDQRVFESRYNDLRMGIMEKSLESLKVTIDQLKK